MTLEDFFRVLSLTDGWRIFRPFSMIRRFDSARQCPITAVASELGYGDFEVDEFTQAGRKMDLPGDVIADLVEASDGLMRTPRQWEMRIRLLEATNLEGEQ